MWGSGGGVTTVGAVAVPGGPRDCVLVVDKPPGLSSHGVVARVRRLAGTRKVGHAGTLDPMATGILVIGVGRATRLLGHLMSTVKAYDATIRLGEVTSTDDADGESWSVTDATGTDRASIERQLRTYVGDIEQVPSTVSAIKIDGKRAYARVRAGEQVELGARAVRVDSIEVRDVRHQVPYVDVDVSIVCSAGTYVRAIGRDLGAALGVGGHLVALRRTRVGQFTLADAHTLEMLAQRYEAVPISAAARRSFPSYDLDDARAAMVRNGRTLPQVTFDGGGAVALFDRTGTFLALYEQSGADGRPIAVFVS